MSDSDTDALVLAPGTEALLDALLKRHGSQERVRPITLDTALQVRYLCHALSSSEARQVEHSLTASAEARRGLRDVRRLLESLKRLSWSEVADRSRGNSVEAETAQAWLALAAQPVQSIASEANPAVVDRGVDAWTEVKRRAEAGAAQAQGLWTALLAFGSQLQTQLQRRVPAMTRESDGTLQMYGGWQGECRLIDSHIDRNGILQVSVALTDPNGAPSSDFTGRTAYLALCAGGELLLSVASTLEGEKASWSVAEIGRTLGQTGAVFPARGLVILIAPTDAPKPGLPTLRIFSRSLLDEGFLVAASEPPPALEEVVGLLAANILTAQGHTISVSLEPLEIVGSPRAEKERLQVAVRLPEIMRVAYAADHRLLLEIAVAPGEWQHLGSWPLEAWGETARMLSIPCPGLADGPLASFTQLRASLAPVGAGSPDAP